jgi:hypothetical protein
VVSRTEGQPHWEILAGRLLGVVELRGLLGNHEVEGRAGRSQPLVDRPRSSTVGAVKLLSGGGGLPQSSCISRIDRNPYGIIVDGARRPTAARYSRTSTLTTRKTVITWMVQDDSLNNNPGLYGRTIQAFPEHFRGQKTANVVRASRWWALRNEFCNENENANSTAAFSCNRSRLGQRKRMLMKAAPGRGTKCSEWVMWLYPQLLDAFNLFRKIGVKFSSKLLIEVALSMLLDPTSIYTAQSRDPKDNRLLIERLNHSWVQRFMDVHNIVLLSQRRKLSCSPGKEM